MHLGKYDSIGEGYEGTVRSAAFMFNAIRVDKLGLEPIWDKTIHDAL